MTSSNAAKTGTGSRAASVEQSVINPERDVRGIPRPGPGPTRPVRDTATKPLNLSRDRQEQLRRLAATGEPVRELATAFGIGRATAYGYLAGGRSGQTGT